MGKKQHQKDKLYITNKEWKEEWGGKKDDSLERAKFRRLPFNCCSLSFQPFEHPLATKDGVVFDLLNIVPYLKKHGSNPVTGEVLHAKDLIKLNFSKNIEGKYQCPVTFKVLTENSKIVAIKTTGNVFSYEAVEKLNLRPKNYHDLLTDEEFKKKDIITIQDPTDLKKFNISDFHHVKNSIKMVDKDEELRKKNPMYTIRKANTETQSTLAELEKTYKEPVKQSTDDNQQEFESKRTSAHYSTGAMAGSFTSTSIVPQTKQTAAIIDKDVIRYSKIKKKAYIKLETNFGDLNLELHSDAVPKTCENFVGLCKKGYYDNVTFHRLIKNFVLQGGDPTGTGTGGESFWGEPFKDEFKANLIHQGRGILSMANSGKDSNKSQFFITFRSCRHLDNKHSVFGRVVGGINVLSEIERIETDDKDKPKKEVKIVKATVFIDPFDEVDKEIEAENEKEIRMAEEERKSKDQVKLSESLKPDRKVYKQGVGKYIPTKGAKRKTDDEQDGGEIQISKKKQVKNAGFGDFSSW
eukprot:gene15843-17440_t